MTSPAKKEMPLVFLVSPGSEQMTGGALSGTADLKSWLSLWARDLTQYKERRHQFMTFEKFRTGTSSSSVLSPWLEEDERTATVRSALLSFGLTLWPESAYGPATSDAPEPRIEPSTVLSGQIQVQLDRLDSATSPSEAEDAAQAIADWLSEASASDQLALASALRALDPARLTVLMAALVDMEAQVSHPALREVFSLPLFSEDKILAQTAASCLISCCGLEGRRIVERALEDEALPHRKLIQGILSLLG